MGRAARRRPDRGRCGGGRRRRPCSSPIPRRPPASSTTSRRSRAPSRRPAPSSSSTPSRAWEGSSSRPTPGASTSSSRDRRRRSCRPPGLAFASVSKRAWERVEHAQPAAVLPRLAPRRRLPGQGRHRLHARRQPRRRAPHGARPHPRARPGERLGAQPPAGARDPRRREGPRPRPLLARRRLGGHGDRAPHAGRGRRAAVLHRASRPPRHRPRRRPRAAPREDHADRPHGLHERVRHRDRARRASRWRSSSSATRRRFPAAASPPPPRSSRRSRCPSMDSVLVTEEIADAGVDLLRDRFKVDVELGLPADELAGRIGGYDGLIVRSATRVTSDLIDRGRAAAGDRPGRARASTTSTSPPPRGAGSSSPTHPARTWWPPPSTRSGCSWSPGPQHPAGARRPRRRGDGSARATPASSSPTRRSP